MKKKALFVFIPIILTVFFTVILNNMHTSDLKNSGTLIKAFSSSGASIVRSECYVWGRLDQGYCRKIGVDRAAEAIAERLDVLKDARYLKNDDESDNIRKISISGFLSDGRKASVGVQLDRGSLLESNYSVTVSLVEEGQGELLKSSGESALRALKGVTDKTSMNFCITGNLDSKLDEKALEEMCEKIFDAAGARHINGIEDRDMISVSAYSPAISNHIELGGKPTNLNLAVRYNSYEGKTYIWLATPVITTEY